MSRPETGDRVVVGKIGKPKGLQGHLFVDLYNPTSDILERAKELFTKDGRSLRVEEIVHSTRRRVVKLKTVDSVDDAKKLTGEELCADRKDLPPLGKDEILVADLVGFGIEDAQGNAIGNVTDVISTASNDVWVVKKPDGEELLVPLITGVLLSLDKARRLAVVQVPEFVDAS